MNTPESLFKKHVSRSSWPEYLTFIIYLAGVLLIIPYTKDYVNNPDAFQYLNLAKKYASGHFHEAINAYWSPLLSFLIVPFLFSGMNAVYALKLVQVLIGLWALLTWTHLLRKYDLNTFTRFLLTSFASIFILRIACLETTADLLFLSVLLGFINILLNTFDKPQNSLTAFKWAAWGALLYLSKAFGAVFFISISILLFILVPRKHENDRSGKKLLFQIILFLFLIAPWVLLISSKQGHFTINDAARFNFSYEVAPLPGEVKQLPVLNGPLIRPPDQYAISAWEAPGDMVTTTPLHPVRSSKDRSYYFRVIKRNLLSIWYYDFNRQAGSVFLVLLATTFLLCPAFRLEWRKPLLLVPLMVTGLIYSGYSLILVHTRYTWICTLLMMLMIAVMTGYLSRRFNNSKFPYYILALTVFLAMKRPVKELLFLEDKEIEVFYLRKALVHPFLTMDITYRPDRHFSEFIGKVEDLKLKTGNLASFKLPDDPRHGYSQALALSFPLGWKYFGVAELTDIEKIQYSDINYLLIAKNFNSRNLNNQVFSVVIEDPNSGYTLLQIN